MESLQGKNPRDFWRRTRRKRYGDFGVAFVMGKPLVTLLRGELRQMTGVIRPAGERRRLH